ncbi:hypothetical protein MARPO_0069s0025 [Marchantia polymorpha]|uniref:Uncharacterized protein n=1 Tax=Marchantia polymorpha TaxID=3197 RepID=A0A2R6WP94_MARPO|nr:hypothetical protein MARPO_0069s0025 [Marchantia polymorpha]|eukprot:PTQ35678.1 hypothetical protein MARPO_0069s0025 [Marchantia polymorpha]
MFFHRSGYTQIEKYKSCWFEGKVHFEGYERLFVLQDPRLKFDLCHYFAKTPPQCLSFSTTRPICYQPNFCLELSSSRFDAIWSCLKN